MQVEVPFTYTAYKNSPSHIILHMRQEEWVTLSAVSGEGWDKRRGFISIPHRTRSSSAGTAATALRVPACLQREVAEGAGGKMEERGNVFTDGYVHKMTHVHKLKHRLQHS